MRKLTAMIVAGMLLTALTGCVLFQVNPASQPPVAEPDFDWFVEELRDEGAQVRVTGNTIRQEFYDVTAIEIFVDGWQVQVFEFADGGDATAAAALVSDDGSTIGTVMIDWIDPPHFYIKGRIVVLYVGDDPALISLLIKVLGPQFAGR